MAKVSKKSSINFTTGYTLVDIYTLQDQLTHQNISYMMDGYETASCNANEELKPNIKVEKNKSFYITKIDLDDKYDGSSFRLPNNSVRNTFSVVLLCEDCRQAFPSEVDLTKHKKEKHMGCYTEPKKVQQIHKEKQPVKTQREYKCVDCNKIYKNHNGLKYHNNKHHQERIKVRVN